MNVSPTRRIKACESCRNSKKKCDGNNPCGRCSIRKEVCTYTQITLQTKKISIEKLQSNLPELATRRLHIESYFRGSNPIVVYNNEMCASRFDVVSTPPLFLQYYAILATTARHSGLNTFQTFENKACALANELLTEFSYDAALGFNFLSFYFWGSKDIEKCILYKDICISITKRALQKMSDPAKILNLLRLQIITMSIHRNTKQNIEQYLQNLVPVRIRNSLLPHNSPYFVSVNSAIQYTQLYCLFDQHLLIFGENLVREPGFLSGDLVVRIKELLSDVYTYIISTHKTNNTLCLQKIEHSVISYGQGCVNECFTAIEDILILFCDNQCMIKELGPRYAVLFHSLFLMAFNCNKFDIASRVNGLQKKYAETTPAGEFYYEKDFQKLQNTLDQFKFTVQEETSVPMQPVISYLPTSGSNYPSVWVTDMEIPMPVLTPPTKTQQSKPKMPLEPQDIVKM